MCNSDGSAPAESYKTQPLLQPGSLAPVATSSRVRGASETTTGRLVVEDFHVTFEGYTYRHGKIAYVEGRPPAPIVMVHPNYAGLKQFDIDQASFLARVGYVGVAIDILEESPEYRYEDRNPDRSVAPFPENINSSIDGDAGMHELSKRHFFGAFKTTNALLLNPKKLRALIYACLTKAREHPAAHKEFAGSIGYCLGGQTCLEQVRAGHDIQGIVTFHGLLQSYPFINLFTPEMRRMTPEEYQKDLNVPPNTYNSKCKVLIENGAIDDHVPLESVDQWMKEMDANNIDWRFENHARTPHGFALARGVWSHCYMEDADRRSTLSMLSFFAELWPQFPQYPVECNACGTKLGQAVEVLEADSWSDGLFSQL
mmetsp:Transcript_57718/g.122786  ORF Transcript_57718/g.122786 Transcript_57718/m.122786 type:complete len:370 (+) Transcript_57718:105-1214(+)